MFAIVKTAGSDVGKVKSVHRSFLAAFNKQPATFYGLVNIGARTVKPGEVHPTLVTLLDYQNSRLRKGLAVTGGATDWIG